jgi:hypothetical protein
MDSKKKMQILRKKEEELSFADPKRAAKLVKQIVRLHSFMFSD